MLRLRQTRVPNCSAFCAQTAKHLRVFCRNHFFFLLKFRGNFHVPSFASLTPQHKSPWLFLIKLLKPHCRCSAYKCPSVPRGTQSPTKKEKECQRIFPEEAPAGETSETKIFCNFDLLPWEIFSLEYCKNGHRQPSALEFPAYRFNQVWIEKIGLKRNWGWSGNTWAIWWDRMAINVLKRSGLRLSVSGSRFNEYWSKRIWREQALLFLFSHVTGFLRRCKQTTRHQQRTKDTI